MTVNLINRTRKVRIRDRRALAAVLRELLRATGLQAPAPDNPAGTGSGGRIDVYLVGLRRMRRLNRSFTGRARPTDVLAFDYRRPGNSPAAGIGDPMPAAEIFVCPEMAVTAAPRYRTTVHREILRYVAHGLLHLAGFDDHDPDARRRMRRAERRLLELAERIQPLEKLFEAPPPESDRSPPDRDRTGGPTRPQ